MANFEQPSQQIFDFDRCKQIAKEWVELRGENSDQAKMKKSSLKNLIKGLYGKAEDETPMRQIFDMEVRKQELMLARDKALQGFDKLKTSKKFSKEEEKEIKLPVATRPIQYNEDVGDFTKVDELGKLHRATRSDLLSGISWDNFWDFDESVPVEFRKQYAEAVYQAEIDKSLNSQLILRRITMELNPMKAEHLINTYKRIDEQKNVESAGLLFEKMINNLMLKISADFPEWGVRIKKVNVLEDVEQKIDFWIEFDVNERGVRVEEVAEVAPDKPHGIQFTIVSPDSDKFQIKQKQVDRSKRMYNKDILLISVQIKNQDVFDVYHQWQMEGKNPGGPENLFGAKDISDFIAQVLQGTKFVEVRKKDGKEKIVLKEKYNQDVMKRFSKK